MIKLKYETYEKLVRLFNFDPNDYDLWNEMLYFYDSDAIDKAVNNLILKRSKAPTIADVAKLAEEIEVKNRTKNRKEEKTEEEKKEARVKLFEEAVRALEKNYYLVFRKIESGDTAYSWVHGTYLNNTANLKSFDIKNPNTGESVIAFFENN